MLVDATLCHRLLQSEKKNRQNATQTACLSTKFSPYPLALIVFLRLFLKMDEALLISILQIIAIDIVLGGDNAIIIALACRNLPEKQKKAGILWGTAGAIILRCILVFFATTLLTVPGLKLIGGVLLLWIGVKLLVEETHIEEGSIKQPPNLMDAIRTIIIADFVMSLDNSIAIAAAAKGNIGVVIFGLLLSVPIIIGGSAIILRAMTRYPIIITAGGALLGWLGGDMISTDPLWAERLAAWSPHATLIGAVLGAAIVVALGELLARRAKRQSV
jgi:YjbE family integral membrane protein